MTREFRLLVKTIFVVQSLAGSKISTTSLQDSSESIKEVFYILAGLIESRNNRLTLDVEKVTERLEYTALRDHVYPTVEKWADQIEELGISQDIDMFPYEYEEFENIYETIFFSELEMLAKDVYKKDKKLANFIVLLSMALLGYAVGLPSFASKADFLLGLKNILKSMETQKAITMDIPEGMLELLPAATAHMLHKTITAGGATAQALEAEDLEGGTPTRINLMQHPDWKKKRKKLMQKVDEAELRNLLSNR